MKAKRILANLLVFALLFSVFTIGAFAAVEPATADSLAALKDADLVILHTNDTHGYVRADDSSVIGFDYIAGIKKAVEALGVDVILADIGDFSNGQPVAALSQGESPLEIMIAGGWDLGTLGNHEFDFKDSYKNRIAQADGTSMTILTDIVDTATGKSYTNSYAKLEMAGGLTVGVFAVTTPETVYKALFTDGIKFNDIDTIIKNANADAKALRDDGCDIVIGLTHLGTADSDVGATSIALAEGLAAGLVDVLIDAHSHTAPEKDQQVNGVWIVSAGGESNSNVGVVAFTKADDGKISVVPSFINYEISRTFTPDAEITALIEKAYEPVEALKTTIVAQTPVDLNGVRGDVRTGETNLGNTLADAVRAFAGADIGFTNGGGIRDSIPAGDVSYAQVFTVLPFGNVVYKANVKGSDIWAAIEVGVSSYPDQSGGFPQVSGMSYVFDPELPKGERVVSITVGGKAIDLNAEYSLATNDFTAAGGDGYTMFKAPFQSLLAYDVPATSDGSPVLCDVLAWYLNETGPSAVDGRIKVYEAPAEEAVVEPEAVPAPEEVTEPELVPEPAPAPASGTVYIVVLDDSLSKIAKSFGTTWQIIYDLNTDIVKDPNLIFPGQSLKMP